MNNQNFSHDDLFKMYIINSLEVINPSPTYNDKLYKKQLHVIPAEFLKEEEFVLNLIDKLEERFMIELYQLISPVLWDKEEFVLKIDKNEPYHYSYISWRLKKDRYFILKFIEINPNSFQFLINEFKDDEEIAIRCIKRCAHMIQHAGKHKNNKKCAIAAIKRTFESIIFISPDLINDKEILYKFYKQVFLSFDMMDYPIFQRSHFYVKSYKYPENIHERLFGLFEKIKDEKLREAILNLNFSKHYLKNHGIDKSMYISVNDNIISKYLYCYVGHKIEFYDCNFDININYQNRNKRKFMDN